MNKAVLLDRDGVINRERGDYTIRIEEIYYCVHHPETGSCLCRKPDSLNVEKALARFNIDPSRSFFIGDKERDVLAGEKVGVKGILIESNSSLVKAIQPCIKK